MTDVAAAAVPAERAGSWKNLGVGGFAACITFTDPRRGGDRRHCSAARAARRKVVRRDRPTPTLPITKAVRQARRLSAPA